MLPQYFEILPYFYIKYKTSKLQCTFEKILFKEIVSLFVKNENISKTYFTRLFYSSIRFQNLFCVKNVYLDFKLCFDQ